MNCYFHTIQWSNSQISKFSHISIASLRSDTNSPVGNADRDSHWNSSKSTRIVELWGNLQQRRRCLIPRNSLECLLNDLIFPFISIPRRFVTKESESPIPSWIWWNVLLHEYIGYNAANRLYCEDVRWVKHLRESVVLISCSFRLWMQREDSKLSTSRIQQYPWRLGSTSSCWNDIATG